MSDFTYACPVCHQHLKCTVTQAGTVMKCPTCYQRIVAPQAPSQGDSKLILTGQKYVEKTLAPLPPQAPNAIQSAAAGKTGAPMGIILTVMGVLAALGAAVFVFTSKSATTKSVAKPAVVWQTSDIGVVNLPGSFSQVKGVFTIRGAGADIWYQADAFRYVYQRQMGDFTLTIRVLDLSNTDKSAKAGIMVRGSLNANAEFVSLFLNPNSQEFQQRKYPDTKAAIVTMDDKMKPPGWLRLVRRGNEFTGYASENGATWIKLRSIPLDMAALVYVGLAVCSHNANTLCEAHFDQVELKAGGGNP